MTNHLANENSPYLLQHAANPVDWYPWGDEALAKAARENKPIFLSIGYAACHWCHVMAHESFEDARTAAILNENFVSIKVDREQRPDLDAIYMSATQALIGSGGWPMSVFLTPDMRPFYAGTYFPPVPRHNLPAFSEVLLGISKLWRENPAEIRGVAAQLTARLASAAADDTSAPLVESQLDDAAAALLSTYDDEYGGWGPAPKFPQPMSIEFLLRRAVPDKAAHSRELDRAEHVLRAMARGGMYDVVGGGFSRYSTDPYWRVPHFEKMLYDNAQLALAYLHAWQLNGDVRLKSVSLDTLDFVRLELSHPDGGFYSSIDADSGGVEGQFYVWTKTEIEDALDDVALSDLFAAAYGISEKGNWEGKTVLQRALDDATLAARFKADSSQISSELLECRRRLLAVRQTRPRPATDDKALAAWNGLMLRAFAQAGRFVDDLAKRMEYTEVATRNAAFLLSALGPSGQLRRTWRNGQAGTDVFLEDYASVALGLLDLYQTTFEDRWFAASRQLADELMHRFADPVGGFFDTPSDAAALIVRPKELQDNATPSGNALACDLLLKLSAMTGKGKYRDAAEAALRLAMPYAARYPTAFAHWLNAADFAIIGDREVAILYPEGASPEPMLEILYKEYRPNLVMAASLFPPSKDAPPLLASRDLVGGRATAYVCENLVCNLPVNAPEALRVQLG